MRPDYTEWHAEKFHVPHHSCNEPDLVDGTPESPQEHCHKPRRTLMPPQEWELARCTTNQHEMKTDSLALASEPCQVDIIHDNGLTSDR